MIVILDYGVGNVGSIANMCRRVTQDVVVSGSAADLGAATRIILPGVGAFDHGMQRLCDSEVFSVLSDRVRIAQIPLLGICLGMQMLGSESEEGKRSGLGWIPGTSRKFLPDEVGPNAKIPHMGWNSVNLGPAAKETEIPASDRFYFVHSFHFVPENQDDILATSQNGAQPFVAAIRRDNVMGVQFHPEKSLRFGLSILRNFIAL